MRTFTCRSTFLYAQDEHVVEARFFSGIDQYFCLNLYWLH
jgi:hypothetical protein